MKCNQANKLINEYLDQHLAESERKELENHIQSCPSCQKELEDMKHLFSDISLLSKKQVVPEGLTQAVMSKIQNSGVEIQPSFWERLKHILTMPRFSLRWIGAAAVSFVALVVFINFIWLSSSISPNNLTEVQFSLKAGPGPLNSVAVVGDFNDWDPDKHLLQDDNGDGVWTASLKLEPGRYEYMFILDGQKWVPDPEAYRYVRDGFGNKNAVIEIANCI